ncbi:MAG: hypothetical protein ACR2NX_14385 [Chthoniobacterales bacterium]
MGPALVTVFTNGIPSDAAFLVVAASQPLSLVNAVSRKVHASAGSFDIILPAVESRTGGATGDYTIVFTFTNPLASVAVRRSAAGPEPSAAAPSGATATNTSSI